MSPKRDTKAGTLYLHRLVHAIASGHNFVAIAVAAKCKMNFYQNCNVTYIWNPQLHFSFLNKKRVLFLTRVEIFLVILHTRSIIK